MATNFDRYTHQQLLEMIASLDPETVKARGTQLTEASKAIERIGKDLKDHRVKGWEGEAAEAFQNWVNSAGSATLVLSEYSHQGGHWMTLAAQTMVETKANMPKYDAAAAGNLASAREFRNDPDAQQIGQQAHSKLSADHTRAVDALKKLSESYEQSHTQMKKAQVPRFPPPPPVLVPVDYNSGQDMARPAGGSGGGASAGSPYTPSSPRSSSSDEPGWVEGHQPKSDNTRSQTTGSVPTQPPMTSTPDREVNVGLDNVTTLPNPPLPPTTVTPGGPLPVGPVTGGPHMVPPLALPPTGGLTLPRPNGPGGNGLFPNVSGPGGPGGKAVGYAGLPPRDSGITGGRPVSPAGPGAGIPRGTVIGAEGTHAGGRGMGGGMMGGMGGGAGGSHGGPGGSAMGRRLATEPGGVVGGRQPGTGSQPFTQGGSGLVRNPGGTGAMGHAGAGARTPGNRREDQGGERPDYLAEDEETWKANRRVVPPVID
ncbi:hypothetical protein ABZX75_22380 [Streptomyces sp. NPDC003038]|uniref:WXG100 family type VII secretion target n=1 Tax=unclassified Streptomyces TaxID=2593676 RepID=UPI0033A46D8D